MKMGEGFHRHALFIGIAAFGIIGAVTAVDAGQAAPDLSGKWTGFTPTGVNGGVNTFTQNGNSIAMRHPNGQTTAATIAGALTLVVQAWNSTGRISADRARIVFQGGSMDGWTFVKEGATNEPKPADTGGSIDGTYIDPSAPLTMKPPAIWVIKKLADGQYQAKIQEAPPRNIIGATKK